ncbi:hypothetical protein F5883DRAFT_264202 [Diaporthe sp. PMI_573]|nr:hypothetical protein F5883DRAFT_264202 [Diaporthaceae sp. PMI_573]
MRSPRRNLPWDKTPWAEQALSTYRGPFPSYKGAPPGSKQGASVLTGGISSLRTSPQDIDFVHHNSSSASTEFLEHSTEMNSTQQIFLGQNWQPCPAGGYPYPLPRHEDQPHPSASEPNTLLLHEQWGSPDPQVEATQENAPPYYFQELPALAPFPMPTPATTSPSMEPRFAMGTSSLPVAVPLPAQSHKHSPYAFLPYLESTAYSPQLHVSSNPTFTCPDARTLPSCNQFVTHGLPQHDFRNPEWASETTTLGYGQDFARQTPTPASSSASSPASSAWDSCPTTDTSLSSQPDTTSGAFEQETRYKWDLMTGSSSDSEAVSQPAPIDAKKKIWKADMLLGKWTRGRRTWYLVKWKGFDEKHSTWEKRKDIGTDLIDEFEASYEGNHFAIKRLVEKRIRRGVTEYLVEWKGPGGDDSWEKEAEISRARIMEFEGGK